MAPEDPSQTLPPSRAGQPQQGEEADSIGIVGTLLAERYQVGKRLGQGGMAAVYLARDTRLDRTVVVKIPHAALLLDPGFRMRFAGEVSNLTRLEHPNILQIHDVGENAGVPFAVVQYLKGGDLSDRVDAAGGQLAPFQVLEWLPQIAETLDYVHAQGFLHRDVSPGNIIFDELGNSFLSDFGIATVLSANDPDETQHEFSNLTKPGGFVGAAAYAPPESIERKLNPGYDQYSLGVVVYEALSGELPFPRGSSESMLVAKNTVDPAPLSEVAPHLPGRVVSTVMRAISRDPADRFSSSVAFADAFRAALDAQPRTVPAKPAEPAETEVVTFAPPEDRATPWKPILAGLSAIALLAVAGFAWQRGWLEGTPGAPGDAATHNVNGAVPVPSTNAGRVPAAVSFDAGSTAAEQAEAYDLCVRHLTAAGCDRAEYAEEIFRRAEIGPIAIDPFEVTNGEFAAWVGSSGHRTTAEKRGYSWNGFTKGTNLSWRVPTRGASEPVAPDLPVVHVSRDDAESYCRGVGKRLPTEEEWEYGARGPDRRAFPWGDDWGAGAAHWGGAGAKAPSAVGSLVAGASWTELHDMAGNVWEWTRTESSPTGSGAILKGGSWLEANPANLRGAARLNETADYSSSDAGFRCVKDL